MVRAPVAHGTMRRHRRSTRRKAMPGVLGVYGRRRSRGRGHPAAQEPVRGAEPRRHAVARRRCALRWRPTRCASSASRSPSSSPRRVAQAKDAAEAVELDIDALACRHRRQRGGGPGRAAASRRGAGQYPARFPLRRQRQGRRGLRQGGARDARCKPISNRIVVNAMEPRSAVGSYDEGDGPLHAARSAARACSACAAASRRLLGVTPDKLRVLTGNVGGSFGMKSQVFPEYACVLHAAQAAGPAGEMDRRALGQLPLRPSRPRPRDRRPSWRSTRTATSWRVRLTGYGNAGAYPVVPLPYSVNAVKNVVGVYRTPLIEVNTKGVYTNTTPVGAYRGAGRPEGNYYMERLIDTAAAEMGIDRLELRRRNHIAPEADALQGAVGHRPTTAASSPTLLDKALQIGRLARLRRAQGRERSRAASCAASASATISKSRRRRARRWAASASRPTARSPSSPARSITARAMPRPSRRCWSSRLGIPFDRIKLLQGDSDQLLVGGGTGGSRSVDGERHGARRRPATR